MHHCRYQVDRARLMALLVVGLLLLVARFAFAAPGDLDPSFGGTGKVTTRFEHRARAEAVVLQPDGKVLVGGQGWNSTLDRSYLALARYSLAGALDDPFGSHGRATLTFATDFVFKGMALQKDGHILVLGSEGEQDTLVIRMTPEGALDLTFGIEGILRLNAREGRWSEVALQPDGKIVLGGIDFVPSGGYAFAVRRFTSDGKIDSDFGSGGVVTTTIEAEWMWARALAIQADGRIILSGNMYLPDSSDITLVRYTADGEPDPGFGEGGVVVVKQGSDYQFNDVADIVIQPDDRILFGGGRSAWTSKGTFPTGVLLGRLLPDGSLDPSFGNGGLTDAFPRQALNIPYVTALALQADGKILLVGPKWSQTYYPLPNEQFDFMLARHTPTGALDETFGEGGVAVTYFTWGQDTAYDLVVQPDGRIVVVGQADEDFALARYWVDESSPTRHLYLPALHQPLP